MPARLIVDALVFALRPVAVRFAVIVVVSVQGFGTKLNVALNCPGGGRAAAERSSDRWLRRIPMRARPILLVALLVCDPVRADVVLDGTLGPAGALSGPDFNVTAELGRQAGPNLFHSFGRFDVGVSESVTFSGPQSVERIIARINSGQASTIDGLLQNDIAGADLFLINPAGLRFGRESRLNLDGSLYVSSADYLSFDDGVRFTAGEGATSTFSTAAPRAFGFLGGEAGTVNLSSATLDNDDFFGVPGLAVPFGEELLVVGGRIEVAAGLIARDGRLRLMGADAGTEVPLAAAEGLSRTRPAAW